MVPAIVVEWQLWTQVSHCCSTTQQLLNRDRLGVALFNDDVQHGSSARLRTNCPQGSGSHFGVRLQ